MSTEPNRNGVARFLARRRVLLAAVAGALLAVTAGVWLALGSSRTHELEEAAAAESADAQPAADSQPVSGDPVSFEVDEQLAPTVATVPGLEDGDPARPVAAMSNEEGVDAELVLREVIVSTDDPSRLDAFLGRWGGELVDTIPGDDGDPDDHLVRIDPSTAPTDDLADDLIEVEPFHSGVIAVSDPGLLAVLAIVAHETRHHGTEVSLNWLAPDSAIGPESIESPYGNDDDAFKWKHLGSATTQDIGVDAALHLLDNHGRLGERVTMLIYDRGFNLNEDYPDVRKIRRAEWGEQSTGSCGGNPCPWHGTQVVGAAMAKGDNGYGTMGPAWPVAELVAARRKDEFYANLRFLHRLVREESPRVVNMSHGYSYFAAQAATEDIANRRYRKMVEDEGALLIAAAGNNGRNIDRESCVGTSCWETEMVLPCESRYVLCVGGMEWDETARDSGSNFGTKGGQRTVEIYGPFCVVGLAMPERRLVGDTAIGCGTSYAAPHVAGVAALVMAADPTLGPNQVRDILIDSAHQGGLVTVTAGNTARINAAGAVSMALGVSPGPPTVEIHNPSHGGEHTPDEWFDFRGTAADWTGTPLPIRWESSLAGQLGSGATFDEVNVPSLPEGVHIVAATVRDRWGQDALAHITFRVERSPPEVTLLYPAAGTERSSASVIDLGADAFDPDTNGPVPEGAVRWEIRDAQGSVRFQATGQTAEIPANTLTPGSYAVLVSATAGGKSAEDEVTISIRQPDPADPIVAIEAPSTGTVLQSLHGDPTAAVTFRGAAHNDQGALPGTQLRWTARSGSVEIVLCQGSAIASGGGGGGQGQGPGGFGQGFDLGASVSCGEFDATLELLPGQIITTWDVKLEVIDSQGREDSRQIKIDVLLVVA